MGTRSGELVEYWNKERCEAQQGLMTIQQWVNRTASWSEHRELDNGTCVIVHVNQHRVLDEDKGWRRVEHIEVEHDGFELEDPMLETWLRLKKTTVSLLIVWEMSQNEKR